MYPSNAPSKLTVPKTVLPGDPAPAVPVFHSPPLIGIYSYIPPFLSISDGV